MTRVVHDLEEEDFNKYIEFCDAMVEIINYSDEILKKDFMDWLCKVVSMVLLIETNAFSAVKVVIILLKPKLLILQL